MRGILLVVLLSGCAVTVRPSSAVVVTICATPVGLIVSMSDGSQQFVDFDRSLNDLALREQLRALPESRKYWFDVPVCGMVP